MGMDTEKGGRMKVKVFGGDDVEKLEKDINTFLKKLKAPKYLRITQSECGDTWNGLLHITITIYYFE